MTFGGTYYAIRDHDRDLYGARSRQMFASYFAKAPTDQEDPATVPIAEPIVDATTADSTTENSTIAEPTTDEGIINSIHLCTELCYAAAVCQAFEAAGIEVPDVDPVGSKKYVDHRSRVVWNISLALVNFRASFPAALSAFSLCMYTEI